MKYIWLIVTHSLPGQNCHKMKGLYIIFFLLLSANSIAQKTWYGEIAAFGGGGANDIFRFKELVGAASFSGNGFYTGGIRVRRFVGEWFSLETGLSFSEQKYTMHSAPIPDVDVTSGRFGLLTVPAVARVDFLKFLFVDAGVVAGLQLGDYGDDDLSGLGVTAGLGVSYRFESDMILTARAFANQHALVHFTAEEYPHTLFNSGITIGIGYRFIKLGKCHCPDGNYPGRKFF